MTPQVECHTLFVNYGCDILIGMDVIGKGDFAVCNVWGNTTFSFRVPSVGVVDFTSASDPAYAPSQKQHLGSKKKYKRHRR